MRRYLSYLSIGRKLTVGFGLMISLTGLVGTVALMQLNSYGNSTGVVMEANRMEKLLLDARINEKNFLLLSDREPLKEASRMSQSASDIAKALATRVSQPADQAPLSTVQEEAKRYTRLLEQLASTQNARNEAIAKLEEDARLTASRLSTEAQLYVAEGALKKMRTQERNFLLQQNDEAITTFKKEGEQAIQSIEASYASQGAKGQLLHALGTMVTNLRSLIQGIGRGSEDIATSTGELSSVTEQTN